MTRINVGIPPKELCDKHLIAEIRELPRVIGVKIKTPAPDQFKLGTGHVAWCAQYQLSLINRFNSLTEEAKRRGFNIKSSPRRNPCNDKYWSINDEKIAAPIVRERIKERMLSMKSKPSWTTK